MMSDVDMDDVEKDEHEGEPHERQSTFFHHESSDMVFDPDQNPEEKRAVRQNYRSLAKKIEGMRIFYYPFTI